MFTKLIIIAIIVTYVALAISYFLAVAIIRGPIGLDGILILLSPVILALLASIVVIAIQTGSFKSVLVYLSSHLSQQLVKSAFYNFYSLDNQYLFH